MASLSQGRTAAAQFGLFTYKSVPVIFEPPCISLQSHLHLATTCNRHVSSYICYFNLKLGRDIVP